jgi:hypothetical protein
MSIDPDYDDYEGYKSLEERLTREAHELKLRILRKWHRLFGHNFKDSDDYSEHDIPVIRKVCECGESRFIWKESRTQLTEKESSELAGQLINIWLNHRAKLYDLIPKQPWCSNK